jgi:hypothetical protein
VSSHDLDFSSFNKNAAENGGVYDLNLTPYYISDYNVTTGAFKLTRFSDDHVPANTPMILLGKQYKAGKFADDEISFDVPVITMAVGDANKAKYKVWGNNWVWLVPANKTSYISSIDWFDESYIKLGVRDVVFFDNTAITEGTRLALKQTENVKVGDDVTTTTVNTYYEKYSVDYSYRATVLDALNNRRGLAPSAIGNVLGGGVIDKNYILYVPETQYGAMPWEVDAQITGVFKLQYYDAYDMYYWAYVDDLAKTPADGYDSTEDNWILESVDVTTTTPIFEDYTQYFLGANGITPVFKKCNSSGTNGVNYGGAYVRVWSELLGGVSAAREDMSFELFDDDGTEITYQNDEVTGIRSLQNTIDAKKENRQVYNLQGQKLDKMKPGLNIVNGKKYFVK